MTIFRDVEKQLLHKLSELGQGGIDRLHTVETAMSALSDNIDAIVPHNEELTAAARAVNVALTELHSYGATAYIELGLKLKAADNYSGSAGEVLLKSGGGSKDPPPGGA